MSVLSVKRAASEDDVGRTPKSAKRVCETHPEEAAPEPVMMDVDFSPPTYSTLSVYDRSPDQWPRFRRGTIGVINPSTPEDPAAPMIRCLSIPALCRLPMAPSPVGTPSSAGWQAATATEGFFAGGGGACVY